MGSTDLQAVADAALRAACRDWRAAYRAVWTDEEAKLVEAGKAKTSKWLKATSRLAVDTAGVVSAPAFTAAKNAALAAEIPIR